MGFRLETGSGQTAVDYFRVGFSVLGFLMISTLLICSRWNHRRAKSHNDSLDASRARAPARASRNTRPADAFLDEKCELHESLIASHRQRPSNTASSVVDAHADILELSKYHEMVLDRLVDLPHLPQLMLQMTGYWWVYRYSATKYTKRATVYSRLAVTCAFLFMIVMLVFPGLAQRTGKSIVNAILLFVVFSFVFAFLCQSWRCFSKLGALFFVALPSAKSSHFARVRSVWNWVSLVGFIMSIVLGGSFAFICSFSSNDDSASDGAYTGHFIVELFVFLFFIDFIVFFAISNSLTALAATGAVTQVMGSIINGKLVECCSGSKGRSHSLFRSVVGSFSHFAYMMPSITTSASYLLSPSLIMFSWLMAFGIYFQFGRSQAAVTNSDDIPFFLLFFISSFCTFTMIMTALIPCAFSSEQFRRYKRLLSYLLCGYRDFHFNMLRPHSKASGRHWTALCVDLSDNPSVTANPDSLGDFFADPAERSVVRDAFLFASFNDVSFSVLNTRISMSTLGTLTSAYVTILLISVQAYSTESFLGFTL
eukprot:ANDGO_01374.mRNA.1 hypothetical protein